MSQLFHKGLYKEGLRRGKVLGITFTCLFALYSVFFPVNVILSSMRYQQDEIQVLNLGGVNFNPLYVFIFLGYIPFLCLTVFSFLNKRSTSDFYHSLPHKRQTIYFSYGLSILTWVLFSVIATSLIEIVICFFGAEYITIDFLGMGRFILAILAAGVLVMGGTLLSMSMTGTWFTNIITALLILFMPRVLISCVTSSIENLTFVVDANFFPFVFSNGANIIYSFFIMLMGNVDMDAVFLNTPALLYTVLLGIFYLVAGGILFVKRKSESAGNAALNIVIQTSIRVSLCFLVCIIPCMTILGSNPDVIGIVTGYCVALLVYFVYEVISTKKLGNIKKILPGLGIVLLLNLVFIGGIHMSRNVILGVNWQGEGISSVQLMKNRKNNYENPTYEELRLSEAEVKDAAATALVQEILTENQEDVKTSSKEFFNGEWNYRVEMMKVKTGSGKTYYRNVWIRQDKQSEFFQIIENAPEVRALSMDLPEAPYHISLDVNGALSEEAIQAIYETLRQEMKEIGQSGWKDQGYDNGDVGETLTFTISIYGEYNKQKYDSRYTISRDFPKTFQSIIDLVNTQSQDSFDDLVASLGKTDETVSDYLQISLYGAQPGQGNWNGQVDPPYATESGVRLLREMLEKTVQKTAGGELDFSDPQYYLFMSYSHIENDIYSYETRILPVTKEVKNYINEIL